MVDLASADYVSHMYMYLYMYEYFDVNWSFIINK